LDSWVNQVIAATARSLREWCAAYPPERLVVVSLEQLKRDPYYAVQAIYARFGIPFDDPGQAALRAAIDRRATLKSLRERTGTDSSLGPEGAKDGLHLLAALEAAQAAAHASHGLGFQTRDQAR
jgi:hypothetical protein